MTTSLCICVTPYKCSLVVTMYYEVAEDGFVTSYVLSGQAEK